MYNKAELQLNHLLLIHAHSKISFNPLSFKVLQYKLSDNTNYRFNNSKSSLVICYNQVLLYLYKTELKWSQMMARLTNLTSDFSLRKTNGRMILLACWILSLSYLLFALSSTPLWNKQKKFLHRFILQFITLYMFRLEPQVSFELWLILSSINNSYSTNKTDVSSIIQGKRKIF